MKAFWLFGKKKLNDTKIFVTKERSKETGKGLLLEGDSRDDGCFNTHSHKVGDNEKTIHYPEKEK